MGKNSSAFMSQTAIYLTAIFTFLFLSTLASTANSGPKIVILGDSLSAGYQLPPGTGFPEQLQVALDEKGIKAKIIGAGVSGDTTSGGLSRLNWSIPSDIDAVIVELGANDAMRGLPVARAKANLDSIISQLRQRKVHVLLAGMLAPPNMGDEYGDKFKNLYSDLATKHGVLLYPFFLEGVAANPSLNLADAIHPNEAGIKVIVKNILPSVEKLISRFNSEGS